MNFKFFIFLLFFSSISLLAQEKQKPSNDSEDILNDLFNENEVLDDLIESLSNFNFLYVSVNFNSDTYFSGRDIGINQYNLTPQISYIHSNGFFASLSGIYYSQFAPNWDVTRTSIGYSKNIEKKKLVKITTAYSKYFYALKEDDIYSNTLSLGVGVKSKCKKFGTDITGSYLFGKENSIQVSSNSFISLNLLDKDKTSLVLKPQLNIVAGKQTIELAQLTFQNGEFQNIYSEINEFNLINTQLNLPLQFNINSFDFELGYTINFPTKIGTERNLEKTDFFNVSMAYLIDL
ncbi:hypothetical protein SAMN05444411_102479 [Lutibacter oricola]|uniref:Uncharacterized protein n=1 Tax=Lutibacter oricola TaxID=762486 RepID=A0A1H2XII5_9FLAO|nr:hypothetical protein [Lutibacter oricola]SDW92620.1 hypothetical protein SAMN05444411_102479 [Lutibacter oricola]